MEKRIFVAVLLSLAILIAYGQLAPMLFPELARKPAAATAATSTNAPGTNPPSVRTTTAPAPVVTPTATEPAPPHVEPAAANVRASALNNTVLDTPNFVATFSNRGAELVSFRLKHYTAAKGQFVELVKMRPAGRSDYPFAIVTTTRPLSDELNTALWDVNETRDGANTTLQYRYARNGISATKTFKVGPDYLFKFAVTLNPATPYRVEIGPGIRALGPDEAQSQLTITGNGLVQQNDKLEVFKREKIERLQVFGPEAQFVGLEDNYFISVLRPEKASGAVLNRFDEIGTKPGVKQRELYAALNATPDGVVAGDAFLGPKEADVVDKYGLERTLQFGTFGVIARFFLFALKWFNNFTHNWGWAIVVLTILIKIVLYPLQHKQNVSMRKSQKLQPKVEAIKARYKKAKSDPEQRQKMNMEVMKLYQTEGVNPMGGCLPMLVQLPIFWGFYGLLSRAIELRGAPFIGWIHDLAAKDPYYVTPILMTIAMFIQQSITPTTVDPAQKRMFMIMPIMFFFFFKELPSGLVLYWLVQNVLTVIQQLIMNKWWKDHPSDPTESE